MKILIKESELIELLETAMDIDRYRQISSFDSDNGNGDVNDAINDIINKFNELLYIAKAGKSISQNNKSEIFQAYDVIKKIYDEIKYS
jgi:hypothetical protein